jgi:excisionase family DNA binding protein
MPLKHYITTGEVARLLNISRSTVTRKFDDGELQGKKNPITGERLISQKSLMAFLQKYHLPLDILPLPKKSVLLGVSDKRVAKLVEKIFSRDERIKVDRVALGSDILMKCSKEPPALLVIDEELPDISGGEVIKSLRRREDLEDLKILCCSRTLKTNRCLDWGADEALPKKPPNEGDLANKLYSLLDLPQKVPEKIEPFEHQRRHPRVEVNLPAQIQVYPLSAPRLRETGWATVKNISCGGAYLSGLRFEKGYLPAEPFRFLLEVNQSPLENWRAHCKIVRLESNGALGAGVQFVRLSEANLKAVETVTQA